MVKSQDDESDIYKGKVTKAMVEKGFRVMLGGDCSRLGAAIATHNFAGCIETAGGDPAIPHSPLYRIFAKEKLDCCLSKGSWGGLFEKLAKTMNLDVGKRMLIEDQQVRVGNKVVGSYKAGGNWEAGPKGKVAKELSAKAQKLAPFATVDDQDCLAWFWESFWPLVSPGGLYAIELNGCHRNARGKRGPVEPKSPLGLMLSFGQISASSGEVPVSMQGVAYAIFHLNLVVVVKAGKSSGTRDEL